MSGTLKVQFQNPQTTHFLEIANAIVEIDYMLANVDEWSKPVTVKKTFANALDQPMLVKDPLGVVLIISPWNYPVSMILLPLIPAIAAGNTVVIKPSEVSANTAATFEKLVSKYFEPVRSHDCHCSGLPSYGQLCSGNGSCG
ncbi:hypothetical protein ANCDUO_09270 [Ancylostoma duodenale]|uniref:Aldehyde dehydrogenase domain-containing protein n=1 Tax=Ancylostoma duodenale TaxID=51022 RepID=A0A0C2DDF5_9BILA|nr:hypothetical protein ANCDUO_09270 [Ancylostoma duodenale]